MDSLPRIAISLYFLYLLANMAVGVPEAHVTTGVHQTVGPCNVTALDLAGLERQVYLCPQTHDEGWTFKCPGNDKGTPPPDFTEWYTVCGLPHSDKNLWLAAIGALAALGITTYQFAFSSGSRLKTD